MFFNIALDINGAIYFAYIFLFININVKYITVVKLNQFFLYYVFIVIYILFYIVLYCLQQDLRKLNINNI